MGNSVGVSIDFMGGVHSDTHRGIVQSEARPEFLSDTVG